MQQQLQTYSRFNASFGEAAGGGGDIGTCGHSTQWPAPTLVPPYHIVLDCPPAEVGAGAGAAGDDTAMARGIEQTLAEVWSPSPII